MSNDNARQIDARTVELIPNEAGYRKLVAFAKTLPGLVVSVLVT